MHRITFFVFGWTLAGHLLMAQSVEGRAGLGNETIRCCGKAAPGSVIKLGADFQIGPPTRLVASGYPLTTNLGGTSVRVHAAGGVTLDAFIIATESNFVRAVLPSPTPLGEAHLVVSYNGQVSAPVRIEVVKSYFGIYSEDYASFPFDEKRRTIQNIDSIGEYSLNTFVNPARPGQFIALWGTGLGASPGDEAARPNPMNLQLPGLRVIIGGGEGEWYKGAAEKIVYAGRSGFPGIDVVIFEVPQISASQAQREFEGCNVPVFIRSDDDPLGSNEVSVAIARGQDSCENPLRLSASELRALDTSTLKAAQIFAPVDEAGRGGLSVGFGIANRGRTIPMDACGVSSDVVPFGLSSLQDAGAALNVATPEGRKIALLRREGNVYSSNGTEQLEPGDYAWDNGSGGSEVRPLRFGFSVPSFAFTWTNRDAITDANEFRQVTWSLDSVRPWDSRIHVAGVFEVDDEYNYSSAFHCVGSPGGTTLLIKPETLERVLARARASGAKNLHLTVLFELSRRVNVPGFDIGVFTYLRTVGYKVIPLKYETGAELE